MLFKDITYIDENFNVKEHAYIGTKNGVIDYISDNARNMDWGYGEIYNGKGKVLIPGLVNNHTHASMTYLRGLGEDLPLQRWLSEKIFPFESKWDANSIYWAAQLAAAEMMAGGITSYTDMYMFDKAMRNAVLDSGIKCNYTSVPMAVDGKRLEDLPFFSECLDEIEKYGHSNGKFRHEFGLHAEYSSSDSIVKQTAEFAKKKNLRIHTHISETRKELEDCMLRHEGLTPVRYFESCGIFENPTNAAHCVWVNDDDIECLAKNNVFVTHCPSSNLKLGSGIAPVKKMLDAGIKVCIGTDGAASNNNLNMFEEMHLAAMLTRGISNDAASISPKEILKMATLNGALSQGRNDTGCIKLGNKADLAVIDFDRPHLRPCHDVLANIVFSAQASDVVLTMIDGDVVYKDGNYKTLDLKKIYDKMDYFLPKIMEQI